MTRAIDIKRSDNGVQIGEVRIFPPVAIAPMVGLSHSALRCLIMEDGGVGLLYTEMLSTRRLPSDSPLCSPLLVKHPSEEPLFYQIVTTDIASISPALEKLHKLGAQGVDLNLGCPAPAVRKQGAGVCLAENRQDLRKILQEIRRNTTLPVSVKIRLGPEADTVRLIEQCRMIEGEGVNLITIHARLNGEKFCRRPRWFMVGDVVSEVSVPVFVNGGIFSCEDAKRCLSESNADGLMLGRGAVQRPWLAREIAEQIYGVVGAQQKRTLPERYFRFADLLQERFRTERRLGRLKQFTEYYSDNFQFGHLLRSAVQNSLSMDEAIEAARLFFDNNCQPKKVALNIGGADD